MKSRTKSTRENLTIDSKSRRISEEGSRQQPKKGGGKKEQGETRKYLLKTLTLLQSHLKLQKVDKKASNASLSASVFDIVKINISRLPKPQKTSLEQYTSQLIISNKENQPNEVNRSTASLLNMSSIHGKRRSNSTLDEYFKDKFGSPAKDEETIEKKLRVLKALKRSQEIVSRVGQNTTLINVNRGNSSSLLQDVSEQKVMIVEKMRSNKRPK